MSNKLMNMKIYYKTTVIKLHVTDTRIDKEINGTGHRLLEFQILEKMNVIGSFRKIS